METKAAMHEHANDIEETFKPYRESHKQLQREGGVSVFTACRILGCDVEVRAHDKWRASRLPTGRRYGGDDHRGTTQAKLPISQVI